MEFTALTGHIIDCRLLLVSVYNEHSVLSDDLDQQRMKGL